MIQIEEKEIVKGIDEAYKKAGRNAYFGNGFQAGVDFALERVKNLTIPVVSNHVFCDDWIHQERIKNNDDNYCPICGKQLQSK